MIKGTLLVSFLIIKRFVRKFLSPKMFSGPHRKTIERICLKLTDTSFLPSQSLRLALFDAKRRSAVFAEIRLIKKKNHTSET